MRLEVSTGSLKTLVVSLCQSSDSYFVLVLKFRQPSLNSAA